MKRTLKLMGALVLTTGVTTSVVACDLEKEHSEPTEKTDLHSIIYNRDIGNIYVGSKHIINKKVLLKAIKENNPQSPQLSNLKITDFNIKEEISDSYLIIDGIGKYKGEINLSYESQVFKKISNWSAENGKILSSTTDKNGNVYIGTDKGNLYESQVDGSFKLINSWNPEENGGVDCLAVTTNGVIYVSTFLEGKKNALYLSQVDGSFKLVDGWNDERWIANLITDKDGSVYVVVRAFSLEDSLYKIEVDGSIQQIATDIHNIWDIAINNDGTIYLWSYNKTLYKKTQVNSNFQLISSWTHGQIHTLVFTSNDTILIGTDDGLWKSTFGGFIKIFNYWENDGIILSSITDKDGSVYATLYDGVYKIKDNEWYSVDNWSAENGKILSSTTDKNGNVYIETDKGNLYVAENLNQ